jgi:uncharacterized protein (TIGR02594 family)
MKLKANKTTRLLKAPGGEKIATINVNERVTGTDGPEGTNGDFIQVARADDTVGWARAKDFDKAGEEPMDVGTFVAACIDSERQINALEQTKPWFARADLVIARALIETGIKNVGPKFPHSGTGPLQVTSAEWKQFLEGALPFAQPSQPRDFEVWTLQVHGATYRMHADAKAISAIKLGNGAGTEQDPFVPNLLDVFYAYILNSSKGAVAIRDAEEGGKDKTIEQVLTGPLTPAELQALYESRSPFTGPSTAPKTVAQFIEGVEAALKEALKKAAELIVEHAPEELPEVKVGDAPWFDVALEEEKKNVDEKKAEHKAIIVDYFRSTDFHPSTIEPWCGAFAAHCLKKSGSDAVAATVPRNAQRAANWNGWGSRLPVEPGKVPQGAVVVLSPSEGTGSSGHVGFFVQFTDDNKKVELLGGNQSDKLNRTKFSVSKIVHIGWLDLQPAHVEGMPEIAGSATGISKDAIELIVHAEVSSEAQYNKIYHKPVWPKGASGVTIGIGYDIGYATAAKLREDWKGLIPDSVIDQLQRAVGVKRAPASNLARELANAGVSIPWAAAMSVFLKRDMPRWIATVEKALPNTAKLSDRSLGALVSLAYNRGPSFSAVGDRYREMNNIKRHMANQDFAKIPAEFISMQRLWPTLRGLQTRRAAEAELFKSGLR